MRQPDANATMVSDTEAPVAPAKSLGVSGLLLVSDNNDAYAIRVLLARHAVRSIDVMYYLWRADSTRKPPDRRTDPRG